MDNIDYEKAYNEAIERAKNYEREYRSVLKRLMITIDRFREKRYICIDLNELESYFPELKGVRSDEMKEKIKNVIRVSSASDGERICMIDWVETHSKQGEQKQEWSEEDDYNLQCVIAKVTSDIQKGNVGRNNELIDWLKSLKTE